MVSPVSIGQQSFIGSDTHSDFYLDDKVAVWLDQLPLEDQPAVVETQFNDSGSLFDTVSVCTSDMLRQITQGRSASNVSLTFANRNTVLDEEVPSPSSEESRYSSAFLAMFNGIDLPTARQSVEQKKRTLSADSGVGSTYCATAATVEHVIIQPHPPLLESIADETIHSNMSVSDSKLISQCNELQPFSPSEELSRVQIDTSSGSASPEHRSDSRDSGHEIEESTLKTGIYIGLNNATEEESNDVVPHQGCILFQHDGLLCHCDKTLCHDDKCECSAVTVNMHTSSHDPVEPNYTFNDDGYVTNTQSSN